MSDVKKFHGIVRMDGAGEVVCFCSYDEYLRNGCGCREKFNCPEAMIEITVIPGTRPLDRSLKPFREAEKSIQKISKNVSSIKKGLSRLERDMRKFTIK